MAAVDLLKQNQHIRQIAAVNYIEYRTSPTLARYFLLTTSYNLRGFEGAVSKVKNINRKEYVRKK